MTARPALKSAARRADAITMPAKTTTPARVDGALFVRRADLGTCERCARELTGAYVLTLPGIGEVRMGRRCAARTLGWATTAVEMEAVRVARIAEMARRRAVLAAAGLPVTDHALWNGGHVLPGYVYEDGAGQDWAWAQGDAAAVTTIATRGDR